MVKPRGISKRKTDMSSVTEHMFLKEKNTELAKALQESQMLYKHVVDEKNYIQKELFNATLHIKKLENYINSIDTAARESIKSIVSLSNYATDILSFVNYSRRTLSLNETINKSNCWSTASLTSLSKTQAVKPMIDGHVIYSPTINLKRVNEISSAEQENRRSTNNLSQVEPNYSNNTDPDNSPRNDSFQRQSNNNRQTFRHISERQHDDDDDVESNDDLDLDEPAISNNIELNIDNVLSPIEERDELETNLSLENRRNSISSSRNRSHTLSGGATQLPILSGVFRDVRVYLSPVDPHSNITKVRGSSKSHKFKLSSDIQQRGRSTDSRPGPSSFAGNGAEQLETEEISNRSINNSNNNSFAEASCTTSTPLANVLFHRHKTRSNISKRSSEDTGVSNRKSISQTTDHYDARNPVFHKEFQNTTNLNRPPIGPDDPLEGPSSLLNGSFSYQEKVKTLSELGLTPIHTRVDPAEPTTPADAVVKKRKLKLNDAIENTPQNRKKHFVTKRKTEQKNNANTTSKVAKVVLVTKSQSTSSPRSKKSRFNLSPKIIAKLRADGTPRSHKYSIEHGSSLSPLKLSPRSQSFSPPASSPANVLKKRKVKSNNIDEIIPRKHNIPNVIHKKRGRKKKVIVSSKVAKHNIAITPKSPSSPQKRNLGTLRSPKMKSKLLPIDKSSPRTRTPLKNRHSSTSPRKSRSPNKRERTRRAASKGSFKEPSLRKKLRRSK